MKKILRFFVALLLCNVLLCSFAVTASADRVNRSDYRHITSVTGDEIAAIERIKNERGSFEFISLYSSNAFGGGDDFTGGFLVRLCDRLGGLFGIPFTVSTCGTSELIESVDSYSSDFTCEILPRDEGSYLSVATGINRTVYAFYLSHTEPLSLISGHRPLRYVLLENSPIAGLVATDASQAEFTFVSDYSDAAEMILSGKVDAFLDYRSAKGALSGYSVIVSSEYLPLLTFPMSISTANPDLAPFISVIGKYVENGGDYELRSYFDEGFQDYRRGELYASLTDAEREYLALADSSIPFAASSDNYPICFYNETAGEYQGISIDVLDEISLLTGLRFEPSNKPGDEWHKLLSDLENGRTAFASELLYTPARANRFIWPDEAYSSDNYALLSLVEREDISIDRIPLYRVGVIRDTGYTIAFTEWFPEHKDVVIFNNYDDAFAALSSGEVDFIMGTLNLLLNNTNYLERSGYKANIVFDYVYESGFGFAASETMLCSIFSKAQKLIDTEDISTRWSAKMFDYRAELARVQSFYFAGLIILTVVIIVLATILLLRSRSSSLLLEATVRQRTAELKEQTEAAKISSQAKTDFLARMSHEIRTPLNAIMGMSRIAQKASKPASRAYRTIDDVLAAASHLLEILNDILDTSKIEAGKFLLTESPFYFKDSMQEVVNIVSQSCDENGLLLINNIYELPALTVTGDSMRLKQVLINLLGNAAKFTPTGGTISFLIDCEQTAADATFSFTVSDTGIGIAKDRLETIFQLFEQANSSIATRFGGVGLGLSISQTLINLMGGEISVESELDLGSTFTFTITLPLCEIEITPVSEETQIDLSGKKILVVEDVEINRIILREFLASTGADIIEAEDGQTALDMFEKSEPGYYNFIFMDIQMPRLNGYDATRAIRTLDRPDAKTVPIVAVTANAFQDDINAALEAGMNRHIAKPVEIEPLMKALSELLPLE